MQNLNMLATTYFNVNNVSVNIFDRNMLYEATVKLEPRRQIKSKSITFVGLNVYKNSIAIALADTGRNAEVRNYGIIGGGLDDLDRFTKKLVATTEMNFMTMRDYPPIHPGENCLKIF